MKKVFSILLITAMVLSLTACGSKNAGGADGDEKVLRLALNADIVSMDAHVTSNDYIVPMNVFDSLLTIEKEEDGSTKIVPSLAESYEISDDGLTYSFKLRDGVVFSDGTPLTADDVKFTFERILTLPESVQTDFVVLIDGAEDLMAGKADSLKGIDVKDDHNFTITLSASFSGFLAQLATPSTCIYSRKIVTEAGGDFGNICEKTIGTGPYIIKEWERGKSLTFEANPKYWGEAPSAKKVVASVMDPSAMNMAFQKGDLDIIDCIFLDPNVVDSTYRNGKYDDSMVKVDRMGTNFFMLNEAVPPLDNPQVRQAIQMAIDRQSILDSIYNGDGKLEDGIYPTGCVIYSNENQGWLKYDPEGAKKLLGDAGFADGFDMEISLDSSAGNQNSNMVQVIQDNLAKVGINASIKSYDRASYLDLRNSGKAPSYLALWLLDYNDPDNIIYTFFGSKDNTVLRSNNYQDEEVIKRIGDARQIVDPDERAAEYAAIEKKLVQEDAVWVPMFSLKHLFIKGDRVESFKPQWAGWSDMYYKDIVLK